MIKNRITQNAITKSTTTTNQTSSRDITKFGGTESNQSSELTTLTQLRKYILPLINVGTLATVISIDKEKGTVKVKPFPLLDSENQKNITCHCSMFRDLIKVNDINSLKGYSDSFEYKWKNLTEVLTVDDIVCVVFMDRNFEKNLSQARSGNKLTNLNDETKYHSDSYGIVVSVVNKKIN